jgi:DNA polymerase-3 subunit beta
MHFIILKENINQVLAISGRNIANRPQLPILSNIYLKTERDSLKTVVSNLELSLVFNIPAKIEKEGEITVPGKLLSEFISSVKTNKIEFVHENNILTVQTETTKATFSTMPTNDFPPLPKIPEAKNKLNIAQITDTIQRVAFAASNDEGRPVLTGVRIIASQNKINLTATDGYRLSLENIELKNEKQEFQMIIPASSLSEITRIVSELKKDFLGFSLIEGKNQAVFTFDNGALFTRLIEGQFPKVENIIPQSGKTKVVVEKDELMQAVKTTSLFARNSANIIKIKVEKKGLRLSAATPQLGSDEDFVEAEVAGEEMEIAFNFRFLLDLLNNFPEENLIFEASGPLNPGVFKPQSASLSFLHIIMPVRIQGQ